MLIMAIYFQSDHFIFQPFICHLPTTLQTACCDGYIHIDYALPWLFARSDS